MQFDSAVNALRSIQAGPFGQFSGRGGTVSHMRNELQKLLETYPEARQRPFAIDPVAVFARVDLPAAVKFAIGTKEPDMKIKGSAGLGQWADTPWIAIMDPLVTTSTQQGYYVVYLFVPTQNRLVLALAQGITEQSEILSAEDARARLRAVGALLRSKAPEYGKRFRDDSFDLDSRGMNTRTSSYEASIAFGIEYRAPLPEEDVLVADLWNMCRLYRLITFNGGPDLVEKGVPEDPAPAPGVQQGLEDPSRVRLHYRIERNPGLAQAAKKVHGLTCQACGFNFEHFYGGCASGYIEAHHLVPLSELPSDRPSSLNPQDDFAVLCANCHRVVHNTRPPMPLLELQQLLKTKAPNTYGLRRLQT